MEWEESGIDSFGRKGSTIPHYGTGTQLAPYISKFPTTDAASHWILHQGHKLGLMHEVL